MESTDEVGQLANAFNDVNSTTIQVAREQAALRGSIAEMFVNVARRDQVLLNRQLAFLDDLERSEEDANTLSNLFRLDHLATRMRRNAESLLVLAASTRAVASVSPCRFRRDPNGILRDRAVRPRPPEPGRRPSDAGAQRSQRRAPHRRAPRERDDVLGAAHAGRGQHGPRRALRQDHHSGPRPRDDPEEIGEANRKVNAHAASDVVGSQRLGLYVVGRISDRLGARVTFERAPEGAGTLVTVSFPTVLFVPDSSVPLPMPTDPLDNRTQVAVDEFASPTQPSASAYSGPATTSTPQVDHDAPVAVPVDLAALTDGATSTGMPRRRSRGMDPAGSAPSASFVAGPQTGSIILPPLATPSLPLDLPAALTPGRRRKVWRRRATRSRAALAPRPGRDDEHGPAGPARVGRDPGSRREHAFRDVLELPRPGHDRPEHRRAADGRAGCRSGRHGDGHLGPRLRARGRHLGPAVRHRASRRVRAGDGRRGAAAGLARRGP
ncbi:hypothetical protein NKG05_10020 [Oerskovia sp. M15]